MEPRTKPAQDRRVPIAVLPGRAPGGAAPTKAAPVVAAPVVAAPAIAAPAIAAPMSLVPHGAEDKRPPASAAPAQHAIGAVPVQTPPGAAPAPAPSAGFFSKLGRLFRLSPGKDAKGPSIYLAAFGKHPGWDDHVLDLGIETEQLAALQRSFYVRGIGENIDSSAWEQLDPAERLPEFKHAFLWRRAGSVFAGRLWASRDSKMRARYPMVLCAQCVSVSPDWAAAVVPEPLEQAKQRCAATTSASEVRAIVAATQATLREAVAGAQAAGQSVGEYAAKGPRPFDFLADRPEFGPGRRGLLAILYEVERDMAAYRPAPPNASTQVTSAIARHVRVPSCGLPPFEAARLWIEFLTALLSRSASILAIQPIGEAWLDLIVGDPTPPDLFCMMATLKKVPFTSDIPYKLDDEFVRRANRLIDQNRRPVEVGGM